MRSHETIPTYKNSKVNVRLLVLSPLRLLRHKKIEVDARDLHANTALHLSAQNGQIGVGHAGNLKKCEPLHLRKKNHA